MSNVSHTQDSITDEEAYVLSGEKPEAFTVIFDRYVDGFVRRATYILGDKNEAQDAAQEAFIRLYGAASRYVPRRDVPFKSFAYRVLLNTCISMIRRKSARPSVQLSEEFEALIEDDASADQFERYVARDWLASLVARLPGSLAKTVKAVIFFGKTTADVAQEEGVSEGAVRVRLTRATKELRKLALSLQQVDYGNND